MHTAVRRLRVEVQVLVGAPFQIPPWQTQKCAALVMRGCRGGTDRRIQFQMEIIV